MAGFDPCVYWILWMPLTYLQSVLYANKVVFMLVVVCSLGTF